MPEIKRAAKYWICADCAENKKWILTDNAITVIQGHCGYCKRNDKTMLIPIIDFKRGKIEPVWD